MAGKLQFLTYKEAKKLGNYDEMPMLPPDRDPQMYLSNNSAPQPFHVVHEKDVLVMQMSGRGRLEFRDSSIRYFNLEIGDFVYVPAGTATRFFPDEPGVQYRLRAKEPGAEGVIFFSDESDDELYRHMWDTADTPIQQGYLDACNAFNEDEDLRRCKVTGKLHDPVDIDQFNWPAVIQELEKEAAHG